MNALSRNRDESVRNESLKQRILALVVTLPARLVYDLLRYICRLPFSDRQDRLELVRNTFVEYLNTRRPHRAQRLFTDLFGPILISDSVLLRARRMVPGAVQRIDIAGLWMALERAGLSELAARVQRRLDELAETELLDDVLLEPEALALRRQLCAEAIRLLTQLPRDARQLQGFLDTLNRKRLSEARKKTLYLEHLAPAGPAFLRFIAGYLESADDCAQILHDCGVAPAEGAWSEAEAERVAEQLAGTVTTMQDTVVRSGVRSELGQLAPLTLLHVGHQYGAVALYLRESGLQGEGDDAYVIAALFAHFAACCDTVISVLGNALKIDERLPGASIKITAREESELDGVMLRLALVMPALIVAGLLENRQTEPIFRDIWQNLARFLGENLALVAAQRASGAMTNRTNPALDHKNVVWLLRLIWSWHQLARTYDQAFPVFDQWRDQILEDLELAVQQACRLDEGETIAERLDHVLRLDEIGSVFNHRLAQHLPLSSLNVVAMMSHCLERSTELASAERSLVADFLGLVRAEMVRSRNWRNPELAELLRLAEEQGL